MHLYKPLNVPRNNTYGSNYYITYSFKLKRKVIFYSDLEFYNFLTLEMNPFVLSFCEQPLEIQIEVDGTLQKSILDMWVFYKDLSEEFQEVKNSQDYIIEKPNRATRQMLKQKSWCIQNGYKHAVRTESSIIKGPFYIDNLLFLNGALKRSNYTEALNCVYYLRSILKYNPLTIKEIINMCIFSEDINCIIAVGYYEGIIDLDLEKSPISIDSKIVLYEKD